MVVQPADLLNLHPGPNGERSVVRWTATASGTYEVAGRFQGIDTAGTTTDVLVTKNGATEFSGAVGSYGAQAPFALSVTLAAGDVLEFSVGYGANGTYNDDSTGLAVSITPAGAAGAGVRWLVSDQLGTPRMVLNQTGSLSGMTRHDYLPFGEEVTGDAVGRTAMRGYGADSVRQKFTGYERDGEISLDYAQARYYSSSQGRFTSPDPLLASGRSALPQSWNRYSYALNNPLQLVHPTGLIDGPVPCGQQPDGQERNVIVPEDVRRGAPAGWLVDDDRDHHFDGELVLPPAAAVLLGGVAVNNYRAEFIETTDQLNAFQHGIVSQTNVQQETGSGSTSGSSSERSAELSISPKPGATLGGTEGNTSGSSSTGKTTLSQTLDPAVRCNAMALDKAATIANNNAITKLEGITVTVYRGDVASPMKLTRAEATMLVQGTTKYARERGALDATVSYPLRKN